MSRLLLPGERRRHVPAAAAARATAAAAAATSTTAAAAATTQVKAGNLQAQTDFRETNQENDAKATDKVSLFHQLAKREKRLLFNPTPTPTHPGKLSSCLFFGRV